MKRFFFVLCLGSILLMLATAQPKAAATQHPVITIEQVNKWETELSNWGRWGKDDERGSLNLITPQKEAQAARLV